MSVTESPGLDTSSPFRLSPPEPNRSLVLRPRLLEVLGGRFDRRLTVVVGGAGFGKTSVLVQALQQNQLDTRGLDVWLGCTSGDSAAHALASGLLAALGVDADEDREPVESIVAAVWSLAPRPVCLVLDDAHEIEVGSSAAELLNRLLADLPDNGHLLLAGRQAPPVRTAKLRARGELAVLDESDLSFTEAEMASFAALREVDVGAVGAAGGWPALSELSVDAPQSAAGEFLWEEVLDGLDPPLRDTVVRLGPFESIDDDLLAALADTSTTVAEIAESIPLATMVNKTVRIHDLWRSVLLDAIGESALETGWYQPAVDVLRRRGRYREALDALMLVDDQESLAELVDELSRVDYPDLHAEEFRYVLKHLPMELAESGSAMLLRGSMLLGVDIGSSLDAYEAALARFRHDGDVEGETVAQIRRSNVMFIQGDLEGMAAAVNEIALLAQAGVERATRTVALAGAFLEVMNGDPLGALATVEKSGIRTDPELSVVGSYLAAHASAEYGHLERALAEAESSIDLCTGHLRVALLGLIVEARALLEPEDSVTRERDLLGLIDQARILDLPGSVAVASAGYAIWLAFEARTEEADARINEARAALTGVTEPRMVTGVRRAEMVLAVLAGDEDGARAVGRRTLDGVPFGPRPDRGYLTVFDAVYVLLPETRSQLDEVPLGPDYDNYRTFAQTVVRLREEGDLEGAAALPWGSPSLLRRSILEPFLVELIVAASARGVDGARTMLDDLHLDPHVLLRRVIDRYEGPMASEAKRLLRRVPARPGETLRIGVLGPLELRRGGQLVEDSAWSRERVRSLLLYLVDRGRVRRDRAASALWGDMEDEAAVNNLRVTLNHLQQVLQPGRDRDSAPFFIQSDGDYLGLVDDPLLAIDVREFERRIDEATQAESERAPALALENYLSAVDLYRGPYLIDGADRDWGYYDRIRIQSRFVESAIRAGDLLLARGDAREADRLAVRAAETEPFSEPAHRLRARALLAAGDRAAARAALSSAVEDLRAEDLEPEPGTLDLLDRL